MSANIATLLGEGPLGHADASKRHAIAQREGGAVRGGKTHRQRLTNVPGAHGVRGVHVQVTAGAQVCLVGRAEDDGGPQRADIALHHRRGFAGLAPLYPRHAGQQAIRSVAARQGRAYLRRQLSISRNLKP